MKSEVGDPQGSAEGMKIEGDQPPRDIRARSFAYALRTVKLYQSLERQKNGAGWILGKQYLRSASSIGAKIEKAKSGESRADFIHKYAVAQKEPRESLYWLRLLAESGILPRDRVAALIRETGELVSIVTAIIVSSKRKGHPSP